MAGSVTIKILELDTERRVCVVEVTDNGVVLFTGNLGLDELNPDGSANTVWIVDKAKQHVISKRTTQVFEKSKNSITVSINSDEGEV